MVPSSRVAVISLASILLQLQGVALQEPDIYYLICFTKNASPVPYSGFIQMGCMGPTTCQVSLESIASYFPKREIGIQPFTFKSISVKPINPQDRGARINSITIVTRELLTVTCGLSFKPFFDDVLTVYPTSKNDHTYAVAFTKFIKFIVLLALKDGTHVTLQFKRTDASIGDLHTETVTIDRFLPYYWSKDNGAAKIEADNGLAIYCGDKYIQASVPAVNTRFGLSFIIFGFGYRVTANYTLVITTYHQLETWITWTDDLDNTGTQVITSTPLFPGVLVLSVPFTRMKLSASHGIAVALSLQATPNGYNDRSSLIYVPEIQSLKQMSYYVLSVPVDFPGRQGGVQFLSIIGQIPGVYGIKVNGLDIRKWATQVNVLCSKAYYCIHIEHNQTMTVVANVKPAVIFVVYLYAETRAGVYLTAARGYEYASQPMLVTQATTTTTRPIPTTTVSGTPGDVALTTPASNEPHHDTEKNNTLAKWLIFGVFMPLSLDILIFVIYLWMMTKGSTHERPDEATMFEEAGELNVELESVHETPSPLISRKSTAIR